MGLFRRNRKNKTSVIHIMEGAIWAGAEVQLYYLATALQRAETHDIEVILLNHGILEQSLRDCDIQVTVFDESRMGVATLFLKLFTHLLRKRPCIVHAHKQKDSILASAATCLLSGTICVRTMHGAYESRIRAWQLHKQIFRFADLFCGRYLQKRTVSVSAELTQALAAYIPRNQVVTIENAVDTEAIILRSRLPEILPGRIDCVRVAIIGRFVPVKRMDIFLHIVHDLIQSGERRAQYFILGDGPLSDNIYALAAELGLTNDVHFLGFRDNVPSLLAKMDLVLMTSDHEGTPMSLLEALTLQVPIIAHAVGGIPDVLDHGNCGTLISQNRPADFAHAIRTFIDEPQPFREKAKRGYEYVRKRYSANRMAEDYMKLYGRLIRS